MKNAIAPVVFFVGVVLGSATNTGAQTSTVTLNNGGTSDTYVVSTVGRSTTVTKVDRGDPRLHAYVVTDPEHVDPVWESEGVVIEPPLFLGKTFDDPTNIFPTFHHVRDKYGAQRDPKPPYPVELYMQLYPFMFPPPTVEQAVAGTDLVWKYHVRTQADSIMGREGMTWAEFQKYRTKEIERAKKNAQKQHDADAKKHKGR